jgi:predicted Zn-dependent peptidase
MNLLNSKDNKKAKEGKISRFCLKNSLDVILLSDKSTPIVAVNIWYKVGSKDELKGKSGFAHLFEHMMFQGSAHVGKAEHMKLINDVGGWMNGTTSKDRTNYFEVVPSNQLRLALWLEADRMKSLAVNEDNFENQRSTVKEERRLRIDNAPYAPVFYELLDELAYENWAYKHSVMGSIQDLDNAQIQDVIKFHQTYYKPNNAILSIVGDIDEKATLEIVREYFEDIPAGSTPLRVDLAEPDQTSEKRMTWQDRFAPLSGYTCSYHVPGYGQEDYYCLEFIEKLLFDGESSRVFQRLVEKDESAQHIYGGLDSKIGPGTFMFFGQVKPDSSISQIEKGFEEELSRIKETMISEKEFKKINNRIKADYVDKFERVHYKADLLSKYTFIFDNPELIFSEINAFEKIGRKTIKEVANKYFDKNKRNVIEIIPSSEN